MFETNLDVLTWYEKQPRALTKDFLSRIPWHEVKNYELNPLFVPVLEYMRDVETLTEVYYNHLKRTPTGRDPIISKFMERWGDEELTHGDVINRFLGEADIPVEDNWRDNTMRAIPLSYKINTRIITILTNFVGKKFTGAHMTYGAVNEASTLQGYRRLDELANHPVLSHILRAIMREESVHAQFYWNVAQLELRRSDVSQKLARFAIGRFWVPVGQGIKTEADANLVSQTLFGDAAGLARIDKFVTGRMQQLPGFAGLNTVTEKIADISNLDPATGLQRVSG